MPGIGLRYVILISIVILLAITMVAGASQVEHPEIYNMTTPLGKDPFITYNGFYSFEAYQPLPPSVKPIVIPVFVNAVFPYELNNAYATVPQSNTVCIPQGTYSLIVLNVTITETGGPQYDRAFYIFANGVPVFWGSTQEILNSTAWSDLTIFENMLSGSCVTFKALLPNWIVPSIGVTGYYIVNVTLYLYPGPEPSGLPNYFIPIAPNSYGVSLIGLNPFHDQVTFVTNIPSGTYRAVLLMYMEGGELDEFWYANEPATRELLVYYNNYLTAVFNPFETIYTGGIDPFMWKPMPSINTLSFHNPYMADITPLLATGINNVNITLTMTNLYEAYELTGSPYFTWTVSGVLMLWVNESNPMISGKLITAYSSFYDSGPIFSTTPTGLTEYMEYGNYTLNYVSRLIFEHGVEVASSEQSGVFNAYQLFNAIMEYGTLSENFTEASAENIDGTDLFTMSLAYKYPIVFNVTAYITPLAPPTSYPYPAAYIQYATVNLGMNAHEHYSLPGMDYKTDVLESLNSYGFMNLTLEIINPYGGAVVTGISGNYARTSKDLTAVHTYSYPTGIPGYLEKFGALAISPNATDLIGYYQYVMLRLMRIGSG